MLEDSETPPEKKVRRRPDGSYGYTPLDPEYNKKYYREKSGVKVNCQFCNRQVAKMHLERHLLTNVCKIIRECQEARQTEKHLRETIETIEAEKSQVARKVVCVF